MKSANEIRDGAWRLLWHTRWLNRFVFLIVAFSFIRYFAINLAVSLLGSSSALNERLMAAENLQDLIAVLREPYYLRSFLLMMALALFVAMIIDSVASYGLSRIRLSVAKSGDAENWQRKAFSGFRDPLGMFALEMLHGIFVWWPIALIVLPSMTYFFAHLLLLGKFSPLFLVALPFSIISIVAYYRYRQAWFIKAAHSDWSPLKCLRESNRMMAGHKWQCFLIDCAFWRPITFMLTVVLTAVILSLVGAPSILTFISTLLITALNLYLGSYIPLGQAIFHLELPQPGEAEK